MKISGSQLVLEALKKEGVDCLFGYPGGVVIPLFDDLYKQDSIRVVLTRHEQAAVHAADGYARSTGKTGVCLVTSGPGATNTITGLATANFDSVPIVVLTGQVPRSMIGNDAFQEADTVGLTRPVTKHNYIVLNREDLGKTLKEAFYIANTGRPGPVVVDLPKDILLELAEGAYPEEITMKGYNPNTTGHTGQIKRVAKAISEAKKPVFFIGGGMHISGASDIFRKLIDKTEIPTTVSLMGIGSLPSNHPYNMGMLGMHGTYTANMSVSESDLIIGIGVRFDDRVTGVLEKFAPNAKIIHIDIDPASISRNVKVEIPVVGDAKQILEELYPIVEKPAIEPWRQSVTQMMKEHPNPEDKSDDCLSPNDVIRAISDVFSDAIICTEVGQHQMWAALDYTFTRPRSFLTSGGLGTMGYGFPAAIGAQMANPDKKVINIAGDGSIQMNIQEMATCTQEGLPIIIAILNNGYLGMVRQWQQLFQDSRYSSTCLMRTPKCPHGCDGTKGKWCHHHTVDFVKLAEAYGAIGIRVTIPEEIIPALEKAKQSTDQPVIIDFIIERETNVWPMVPAGAAINEMLLGKEK